MNDKQALPPNIQQALELVRQQCVPPDEVASDEEILRDSGALLVVGRACNGPQELLDALKLLRDYRDNA